MRVAAVLSLRWIIKVIIVLNLTTWWIDLKMVRTACIYRWSVSLAQHVVIRVALKWAALTTAFRETKLIPISLTQLATKYSIHGCIIGMYLMNQTWYINMVVRDGTWIGLLFGYNYSTTFLVPLEPYCYVCSKRALWDVCINDDYISSWFTTWAYRPSHGRNLFIGCTCSSSETVGAGMNYSMTTN